MNAKIRPFFIIVVLSLLLVLLSACQGGAPVTSKLEVEAPEAGKTTLTGRVVDPEGKPIAEVPVRLAYIFREGEQAAYVLDAARAPGTMTDADGYFVIPNIDVREYTAIIGDPETTYVVSSEENGDARVWTPEAGKVLDLGTLKADLTP